MIVDKGHNILPNEPSADRRSFRGAYVLTQAIEMKARQYLRGH